MLNVETLVLGAYQTNTYIIREKDSKTCCLIDPGYQPDTILSILRNRELKLDAILLTHGHFDHVGGVKKIAEETGCRVFLCAEDLQLPGMYTAGPLYFTDTYADGSLLNTAGLYIRVLHTPGHTPGSVCLLVDDAIFTGDTLFEGSCGRTDIGGDWAQLRASLRKLCEIEGDFTLFPGHGGSTTLATEKKYNPYMR